MSLGMVYSAALHGMEVKFIRVEADLSNGLPMFHMVGYLSSEVKEAGERVRTAIRNSGLEIPVKKTVINLSPGSVRKRGASFDLPIALAILASQNLVRQEALERAAWEAGGRGGAAPAQLAGDFLARRPSGGPGDDPPDRPGGPGRGHGAVPGRLLSHGG